MRAEYLSTPIDNTPEKARNRVQARFSGEGAAKPLPASSERSGGLLGLDLGTRTGWALAAAGGAVTSGAQDFRPQRFEGGAMRFLRFERWLDELHRCCDGGIGQIAFEEVRRHLGVDAAHAYGGFLGQLGAWCERHGVPYQGVPVGTIKRHATGRGNAGKAEVIAAMRARGYRPADDNEADALAILHWALAQRDAGGAR